MGEPPDCTGILRVTMQMRRTEDNGKPTSRQVPQADRAKSAAKPLCKG